MNGRSTAKAFEFSSLGIGSVLKLHKLAVPPYQREYAWDQQRVDQLYSDLAQAKAETSDYFLGTIVTIPSGADNVLELVDGQQRLTTTALLLAAMRDYLNAEGIGPLLVESIENEFLSTIDRRASERIPRLRLNVDDNDFFARLTARPGAQPPVPSRESHERLVDAASAAKNMVRKIVAPFGAQHRADALNDWLEFLEYSASVILLTAPDSAHAFRMFETLNDRGLKTSQVDLVKSYLFGQAQRRIGEAQAKWSSMRNMLEDIDDDSRGINFLRHTLIAIKQFTRADDVYSTVQNSIRGETNSISFLSDLEHLSRVYVATFRADAEMWAGYPAKALEALRVINRFDIKPLRPLLLSIANRFEAAETATAFEFIAALSVRLLIASTTRSGSIEEGIAEAALAVHDRKVTTTTALKKQLEKLTPDDKVFTEAFATARSSKPDYARYYLRTLEKANANIAEPWVVPNDDPADITLEHILPRAPVMEEWPTFSADQLDKYVRRLGNLCLLQKTPNSNAKSGDFASKQALYAESPFDLTNQLAQTQSWTPAEIDARQERMAKLAARAWKI